MGPAVGPADYRFRIRLTNLADAAVPARDFIDAVVEDPDKAIAVLAGHLDLLNAHPP